MEEAMPFPRLSDVKCTSYPRNDRPRAADLCRLAHDGAAGPVGEAAAARTADRAPRIPNRDTSSGRERAGGWDPYERLKDLAYDGISAEVLYPSRGYAAYTVGDTELEEAVAGPTTTG